MTLRLSSSSSLVLRSATIIAAVLAIFLQDLAIIVNDALLSESMSHILAIPALFAYLIYRKRKMLRAVVPLTARDQPKAIRHIPMISGIILSIAAILFYWYGSYTFTPLEYHMLALPIFTSGLTLILFNTQTLRQMAFPIAFLIFLTPPPSEVLYTLGSTLSVISSEVSYIIAVVRLGIPAILTNEYGNPVIQVIRPGGETIPFVVDIACSGLYSMIGFLIFSAFIAYIIRDKLWKKIALFVIGFSLVYLVNITRITATLLIGYYFGKEIALQLFHMLGGWILIFLGTLLLLVISEKMLHTRLFDKPSQECLTCSVDSRTYQDFCFACGRILRPTSIQFRITDLIKAGAILISVMLLVSIQAPVFALTEGPAQIMIQTPTGEQGNTQLLPQIPNYTVQFVFRDKSFEEIAGQDASLVYVYEPLDEQEQPVWVTLEIGSSTSRIHRWEVCLISIRLQRGWPMLATQLYMKDVQIQRNPPIIARFFAFQWVKTNQTQAVLYWYETSQFLTNSSDHQQKQVKISLIAYPETPQHITESENQLIPFAAAIADHWQPIRTWSQIALFLSQNGACLAAITAASMVPLTIVHTLETRRRRKANSKAYKKLSEENKAIIDAVRETKTTPTIARVAVTYGKLKRKQIQTDELMEKLRQAQETGLVKREIVNLQDEPYIGWKT